MPFLGQQPAEGYRSIAKQTITGNSGTSYSLDYKVTSANDIEVFVNNVRQEPGVAYTASGTTITFSDAITSSDSCYVVFQARAVTSNLIESQNLGTNLEFAGDYVKLPSGTTTQRPSSPINGMARYNTTLNQFEVYQSGSWTQYVYAYSIDYLVIAGGGGAGGGQATINTPGGGGAGGMQQATGYTVSSGTSFSVTIGAGGAGGSPQANGSNGANSSFANLTSIGGGGGGGLNGGLSGGSGGGAGGNGNIDAGGAGTAGQGYAGGANGNIFGGGGGGGAGGPGSGLADGSLVAGIGLASDISGTTTLYAVGGAGGGASTANTGNGGNIVGGSTGYAGASGLVVVRYLGAQRGTGGIVTFADGYTYHTFTSSGTFTA